MRHDGSSCWRAGTAKFEYALATCTVLLWRAQNTLLRLAPPNHEFTEELICLLCRLLRRLPAHKLLELRLLTFSLARTPIFEPFLGGGKTGPSRNRCSQVYRLPKRVTRRLVELAEL